DLEQVERSIEWDRQRRLVLRFLGLGQLRQRRHRDILITRLRQRFDRGFILTVIVSHLRRRGRLLRRRIRLRRQRPLGGVLPLRLLLLIECNNQIGAQGYSQQHGEGGGEIGPHRQV